MINKPRICFWLQIRELRQTAGFSLVSFTKVSFWYHLFEPQPHDRMNTSEGLLVSHDHDSFLSVPQNPILIIQVLACKNLHLIPNVNVWSMSGVTRAEG